ncbi:MAG TPA: hypothetical protein VM425_08700 [Myxococcota bacterium]|nr:hypothetical protein [Myxococcota bacterium]
MRVPRKHILVPHAPFHKIWRCHDREYLLQSHAEKHAYLKCIHDDYLKKCSQDDFVIYSYNVMSNHCHESDEIRGDSKVFSEHMRRAHGLFGLTFNKRHKRLGKVAHDRPKTLQVQDDERLKNLMFYMDCNPVRAGIIARPTDIRWKEFSSCRFYCFGEKNSYDDMLTIPEWYKKLAPTARKRQSKYRSMLDRYMVEHGMKRDPTMGSGLFIGGELWMDEMRKKLSKLLKKKKSTGPDPPDSDQDGGD